MRSQTSEAITEPTTQTVIAGQAVGAKAAVHGFMSELASKGCGIIMISSELPEIMGMADSILVMHEGAVKGRFEREGTSEEDILAAALSDDSADDNA